MDIEDRDQGNERTRLRIDVAILAVIVTAPLCATFVGACAVFAVAAVLLGGAFSFWEPALVTLGAACVIVPLACAWWCAR